MKYSYNFGDNKKEKNKRIIFVILAIIVVIIASSFIFKNNSNKIISKVSSVITSPFEMVFASVNSLFSTIGRNFADARKLTDENTILQEEKKNMELKLFESQRILDENTSLKKMLNINKEYQHFEIKLGKVIFREHDNWSQKFRIDIGKNDGISLNQAVVHQNGLVGYISDVSDNTSVVTTILDPSSSVSVSISTINEPAVLQGDLSLKSNNKLKLTYIPLDTEVAVSDIMYTSGLGSMYPASIPVGKVTDVLTNKNDINRYAIVEPNVNIRAISEVGVILK